jgi:hypothetical protein
LIASNFAASGAPARAKFSSFPSNDAMTLTAFWAIIKFSSKKHRAKPYLPIGLSKREVR